MGAPCLGWGGGHLVLQRVSLVWILVWVWASAGGKFALLSGYRHCVTLESLMEALFAVEPQEGHRLGGSYEEWT